MNTPGVVWQWHDWQSLDRDALYALLELRQKVFILEQSCLYPDIDQLDPEAWHLLGWSTDPQQPGLVACLRLLFPGSKHAEPAIGRVVVHPDWRAQGLGKHMLQQAVDFGRQHLPNTPLRLSAQTHLQDFYAAFGFVAISAEYDEDGIPHIDMQRER